MYTKVCVICGKEFETSKPNKVMCCSPHPKKCLQCGRTFTVTIYNKSKKFCNTHCAGEYRKQYGNGRVYAAKATETREKRYGTRTVCVTSKQRTCLICGKVFTPRSNNRQICYEQHFKPCCICGADVNVDVFTYKKDVTCNKRCMLAKRERTMVTRYGVKGSEARKFNEKKIQTNRLNYGVDWAQQSTEVINRRKHTNLQKYGCENPVQSTQVKNRIKQTCLEKYGVDNPMKCEAVKQKLRTSVYRKYGVSSVLQADTVKQNISNTVQHRYGVPYYCMTEDCRQSNGHTVSKVNNNFCKLLSKYNLQCTQEFRIGTRSYDVKVGNALVEINPTASHNSYINVFTGTLKQNADINYHIDKTLLAEQNGYRCIHVWDWDSWDKIAQMLVPCVKVHARECQVVKLSSSKCSQFLNQYHLQGTCKGQKACYALVKDDDILEVMTFGQPRYNKNFEWEMLRLCTKSGVSVVGGAERLFSHFVEEYAPVSVVSYCDRSKFTGRVYEKLGFKLESTGKPTKHWYSSKKSEKMQHVTDSFLRQRGFDQIFGTNFGKGTSNEVLMIERGYLPVYDCGQMRFGWYKTI